MNGLGRAQTLSITSQPFRECQAETVEGRHQGKYSTQQFAYPKSNANKAVCQSAKKAKGAQ
jgi:hypothetical protein